MKWKRRAAELLLLSVLILALDIRHIESLYPPPTKWTRTYGISDNHDEARSLVQTNDGGYAMLGFTRHYLVGGVYTSDFWLVKTDSGGNTEWNRTYGAPTDMNLESGQSLIQTNDGGYALAGFISADGGLIDYDFWLVKTGSSGDMEWNRTYGGTDWDTATSVVQTSDGGYALAGATNSYGAGQSDIYLVKTDSTGNMMWNRTYGGSDTDFGQCVILTDDGGYVIAGSTDSYGAGNRDFWLIKTDASGNMQWNKTYGGTDMDSSYSVVRTSNGEYAIVGKTNSFGAGDHDFWLVKTDSTGNMMWNQTYGGTSAEEAYSIVQTVDGGYALLGWTRSFGAGGYDCWLVKTDSTGSVEWNQTYGEADSADCGRSVVQTINRGYAMAGWLNSVSGETDFWLVKTGSGGDVNGDGVVDIFDLSIVALAYGSFEGDPDYNPEADITGDGLVDARDLAVVTLNYGIG